MPIPTPVRLFHITAIANLPSICAVGAISSKSALARTETRYEDIAYQGAQGARARREMPPPAGGMLHDYVPFYFAPRSPMLYAIEGGRVSGCAWRQADIVHLETTVERCRADGAPTVFFDRNATLSYANAFTELADLERVAWDLITEAPTLDGFCRHWSNRADVPRYADRMERRQAEFLVKERVGLERIIRVGVLNEEREQQVRELLRARAVALPVVAMPEWYY